jgi:hypothetical protein
LDDIGADGVNDACAVAERHAAIEPALARPVEHEEVSVIEACRLDPDTDFTARGFGLTDIGSHKATNTSASIQMVGFHRCSFTRVIHLDEQWL